MRKARDERYQKKTTPTSQQCSSSIPCSRILGSCSVSVAGFPAPTSLSQTRKHARSSPFPSVRVPESRVAASIYPAPPKKVRGLRWGRLKREGSGECKVGLRDAERVSE